MTIATYGTKKHLFCLSKLYLGSGGTRKPVRAPDKHKGV